MYNAWVIYNSQQHGDERRNRGKEIMIVMQMKTLLLIVILFDSLIAT